MMRLYVLAYTHHEYLDFLYRRGIASNEAYLISVPEKIMGLKRGFHYVKVGRWRRLSNLPHILALLKAKEAIEIAVPDDQE